MRPIIEYWCATCNIDWQAPAGPQQCPFCGSFTGIFSKDKDTAPDYLEMYKSDLIKDTSD